MDIQKPRETVQTTRLAATTKNWFEVTPAFPWHWSHNWFFIQPWETQTERRSAHLVLVGVKPPFERNNV
ncbi:hypothetical protein JVT61DRAFT_8642 [Boletus reticuloceps]|uniref:Uncharacterized protein n=1 Tax=Boletus reticuloceps TaxID=495285 RepID=A0A8I2Z0H8_9AGAM|nr:hypothetical protein JVT61DRAFT_8642 [Boletus reticuloceps]